VLGSIGQTSLGERQQCIAAKCFLKNVSVTDWTENGIFYLSWVLCIHSPLGFHLISCTVSKRSNTGYRYGTTTTVAGATNANCFVPQWSQSILKLAPALGLHNSALAPRQKKNSLFWGGRRKWHGTVFEVWMGLCDGSDNFGSFIMSVIWRTKLVQKESAIFEVNLVFSLFPCDEKATYFLKKMNFCEDIAGSK